MDAASARRAALPLGARFGSGCAPEEFPRPSADRWHGMGPSAAVSCKPSDIVESFLSEESCAEEPEHLETAMDEEGFDSAAFAAEKSQGLSEVHGDDTMTPRGSRTLFESGSDIVVDPGPPDPPLVLDEAHEEDVDSSHWRRDASPFFGASIEGPSMWGLDKPEAPSRPFYRLIMELAQEHQRALLQQRREFESRRGSANDMEAMSARMSMDRRTSIERTNTPASRLDKGVARRFPLDMPWDIRPHEGRMSPFDFVSETSVMTKDGLRPVSKEMLLRTSLRGMSRSGSCLGGQTGRTWGTSSWSLVQSFARERIVGALTSMNLDTASAVAIILSSFLSGWNANYSVHNSLNGGSADDLPCIQMALTYAFTVWFLLELTLRMYLHGVCAFFTGKERMWNLFDCVVVAADWLIRCFEMLSGSNTDSPMENLTVVRILRVLRLSRVVRVVRLIRVFRELRMMVYSVMHCGYFLLWSLVLLCGTMYAFAIYFVNVAAYSFMRGDNHPELEESFGSMSRAGYTLYLSVSGGVSWGEVCEKLLEIHVMHGLVFCFYIFFTTFAVLNIITGIFVENSITSGRSQEEVAQEQLQSTTKIIQEMSEMFESADRDCSGTVNLEEFESFLQNGEVRAYLDAQGLETDKAKGLFKLLDLDKTGELTLEEFAFGCYRLKGNAKSIDLASVANQTKWMSDQWCQFMHWCEAQFGDIHEYHKRLEDRLAFLSEDKSKTRGR